MFNSIIDLFVPKRDFCKKYGHLYEIKTWYGPHKCKRCGHEEFK